MTNDKAKVRENLRFNTTLTTPGKLTFYALKTHMWDAADILRGSIDPNEFRQPIMTLLFLKRLSDQFEEKAERLEKSGISKQDAWEDPDRHSFFIPNAARWSVLSKTFENIGQKIDKVCSIVEEANPALEGVLTNTVYNDKKRFPDDDLLQLVSHFNQKRLRNSDLENEDIFGQAYEYLLEQFADSAGKKAGEFFTPREVVRLLVELVEPKQGMKICDPTCGSGGMLIWSFKYVEEKGGDPNDLTLHGQERLYGNYGMCKMNMILHDIENFRIEHENVLTTPLLVQDGKLIHYDRVIANFPFSMPWKETKDRYKRFLFGLPTLKGKADYAFIQHIFSILNEVGLAAIICSQGVLFRENEEKMRVGMVKADIIDAVISLPAKLFYGTGLAACILILNKNKPKSRRGRILFTYATKDYEELPKRDKLRQVDITKIVDAYKNYKDVEKYCHIADLEEIKENEFNLIVSRYVDTSEVEEEVDIQKSIDVLKKLEKEKQEIEIQLNRNLKELGFKI